MGEGLAVFLRDQGSSQSQLELCFGSSKERLIDVRVG